MSVVELDAMLRAWIASHHLAALDAPMVVLSAIGRRGMVWLVLGALLAALGRVRGQAVWQMALAILLAVLVVDGALKPLVGRLRPFVARDDVRVIAPRPATYSFPSGHAATAFAGAVALGRAWASGRRGLWVLAGLIAFSRIYVGVHYPLDVIAGAGVGAAAAALAVGGTRWPPPVPAATRTTS